MDCNGFELVFFSLSLLYIVWNIECQLVGFVNWLKDNHDLKEKWKISILIAKLQHQMTFFLSLNNVHVLDILIRCIFFIIWTPGVVTWEHFFSIFRSKVESFWAHFFHYFEHFFSLNNKPDVHGIVSENVLVLWVLSDGDSRTVYATLVFPFIFSLSDTFTLQHVLAHIGYIVNVAKSIDL